MPTSDGNRVDRLNKALRVLHPHQEVMIVFLQIESSFTTQIQQMEHKLQDIKRRFPTSTSITQLEQDIANVRNDLVVMQDRRRNMLTMVYNTIRDTYNSDAASTARVDWHGEF